MNIHVQGMLVPMDISEPSIQALTIANNLAKDLDAEAGLVQVTASPSQEVYRQSGIVHGALV